MSVAYYIVLEDGFQPEFDGKTLVREEKRLDAVSRERGSARMSEFLSLSSKDIGDLLGDDVEISEQSESWFAPDDGLTLTEAYLEFLDAKPHTFSKPVLQTGSTSRRSDSLGRSASLRTRCQPALALRPGHLTLLHKSIVADTIDWNCFSVNAILSGEEPW